MSFLYSLFRFAPCTMCGLELVPTVPKPEPSVAETDTAEVAVAKWRPPSKAKYLGIDDKDQKATQRIPVGNGNLLARIIEFFAALDERILSTKCLTDAERKRLSCSLNGVLTNSNLSPSLTALEQAVTSGNFSDVNKAMELFFSLTNTLLCAGVGQLKIVSNSQCSQNKHEFGLSLIKQAATDAGWYTKAGLLNTDHLEVGASVFANQPVN